MTAETMGGKLRRWWKSFLEWLVVAAVILGILTFVACSYALNTFRWSL